MSSTTIIIIVAVAVIWAILFAVFMKFNKKRQAGEQQFVQENANKAILHIYGKSVKVDGKDLSTIDHKTCLLYTSHGIILFMKQVVLRFLKVTLL